MEQELNENQQSASFTTPDYLQEKSDLVANLQSKLSQKNNEAKVFDDSVPYTERSKDLGLVHINQIEEALAGMRDRGDYGTPLQDTKGQNLEADMSFIEKKSEIPYELKRELDEAGD